MRQINSFPVPDNRARLIVYFRAGQLSQTTECPKVMIADEHMYVNAFFSQFAQFFAERMELPFALVMDKIFHPEIEHVSQHIDRDGVSAHLLQHVNQFFLMSPTSFNGQAAKMCIA